MENGVNESHYHCSAEWHLAKISRNRPLVPILYTFALRISQKHCYRFYCSEERLAEHFGYERKAVSAALGILEQSGFFVVISKQCFATNLYEVLTHTRWADAHPEECVTKMEFGWSREHDIDDPLGRKLYNTTGGRLPLERHQLTMLRGSFQLKDEQIASAFESWYARQIAEYSPHRWRGRKYLFNKFFNELKLTRRIEQLRRRIDEPAGSDESKRILRIELDQLEAKYGKSVQLNA